MRWISQRERKEVRVLMTHTTKHGAPRLLDRCELALTALGVVKRVYTDLAVVDVDERGFVVRELIPGLSPPNVARKDRGADPNRGRLPPARSPCIMTR